MKIVTNIKVCYTETLVDYIHVDTTEKDREYYIESHIQGYCDEHDILRTDVEVVK